MHFVPLSFISLVSIQLYKHHHHLYLSGFFQVKLAWLVLVVFYLFHEKTIGDK